MRLCFIVVYRRWGEHVRASRVNPGRNFNLVPPIAEGYESTIGIMHEGSDCSSLGPGNRTLRADRNGRFNHLRPCAKVCNEGARAQLNHGFSTTYALTLNLDRTVASGYLYLNDSISTLPEEYH